MGTNLSSSAIYIAASAFKAYDIRGVVPSPLSPEFARRLGGALALAARRAGVKEVVVGRDGRLSGPDLAEALQAGLLAGGVDVLDIGMVPTPLVYYAAHVSGTGSGVAITGSHNPPQYNGFKMKVLGERQVARRQHSDGQAAAEQDAHAAYAGHRPDVEFLDA